MIFVLYKNEVIFCKNSSLYLLTHSKLLSYINLPNLSIGILAIFTNKINKYFIKKAGMGI